MEKEWLSLGILNLGDLQTGFVTIDQEVPCFVLQALCSHLHYVFSKSIF